MEQFSIGLDFEGAAPGRNKRERFDTVAEFENFGRQTDGFGRVVSDHAVFNRHVGVHLMLLSNATLSGAQNPVKARCSGGVAPGRHSDGLVLWRDCGRFKHRVRDIGRRAAPWLQQKESPNDCELKQAPRRQLRARPD
jgi:hypothetical protein